MVDAAEYTSPENRGICGFCGGQEDGYAKPDANGVVKAACWPCINKDRAPVPQTKRQTVGTIFTDVAEEAEKNLAVKKNPGMAPSTYRPKVN